MSKRSPSRLTFGEIASQLASYGGRWSRARVLDALFKAFWQGEFERDGQTGLTLQNWSSPDVQGPNQATREFLYRILPTGLAWVPRSVRRAVPRGSDSDAVPWGDLADLPSEDYDQHWRREVMERISIRQRDYEMLTRNRRPPVPREWREGRSANDAEVKREAGRPATAKLCAQEYQRRIQKGETFASLSAASRELSEWFSENHPYDKPPRPKSVANAIRQLRRNGIKLV